MLRLDRFPSLVLALGVLVPAAQSQSTTRVSLGATGLQANQGCDVLSISSDGRFVAFQSAATNLVAGDTNGAQDVFVRDLQLGTTACASVTPGGLPGSGSSSGGSLAADGHLFVFSSSATNLVAGDANGAQDVFVRDLVAGTTSLVSRGVGGVPANGTSTAALLSADGRFVVFQSTASNFVAGDSNASADVFELELASGVISRVSVSSAGVQGDGPSLSGAVSADGRFVAFESFATNLVVNDTNGVQDVFVRDTWTGVTKRASVDSGGIEGDNASGDLGIAITDDGRLCGFVGFATNLVPGDTNGNYDVFIHDLATGATTRANLDASGAQVHGNSTHVALSGDGRFVAFQSLATTLVAGDTNACQDVFLRDRWLGTLERLSVDSAGTQANANSGGSVCLSRDARFAAFASISTNLVAGDTNAVADVFLRDRGATSVFAAFCAGDGSAGACPCANSGLASRGCENSAGTGGASLAASGIARLSADSVQLAASGELPTALSILLQGTQNVTPLPFGDGLRCTGGVLKRLFARAAVSGGLVLPQPGDPSLSARSQQLGDAIAPGASRLYQLYYRDANPSFCPSPTGATFNVGPAVAISWGS